MCAYHRLLELRQTVTDVNTNVFSTTKTAFSAVIKELAIAVGVKDGHRVGTHAFRRGMAQDILDAGGSLAVLMRAGDWRSSAFLAYLRESQPQETAVSQMVFNMSDSEVE